MNSYLLSCEWFLFQTLILFISHLNTGFICTETWMLTTISHWIEFATNLSQKWQIRIGTPAWLIQCPRCKPCSSSFNALLFTAVLEIDKYTVPIWSQMHVNAMDRSNHTLWWVSYKQAISSAYSTIIRTGTVGISITLIIGRQITQSIGLLWRSCFSS